MKIKKIPLAQIIKKKFERNIKTPLTEREKSNYIYHPLNKPLISKFEIKDLLINKNFNIIKNIKIKKIISNHKKNFNLSYSNVLNKIKNNNLNLSQTNFDNFHFSRNNSSLILPKSILNYYSGSPKINENNNNKIKNIFSYRNKFFHSKLSIKSKSLKSLQTDRKKIIKPLLFNKLNQTQTKLFKNSLTKNNSNNSNNKNNNTINHELDYKMLIKSERLKKGMRIRAANSHTIVGEMNPLLMNKNNYKKKNMDTCFSKINFISKSLGIMSLFGVFNGHGKDGYKISKILKDFFMNYFISNNNISVNSFKDNFYSILSNLFEDAQKYLIDNFANFNIDVLYSGVTCSIILFTNQNRNKIYCANCGDCKCLLYTNGRIIPLSYEHKVERPSEKIRIVERMKNYKYFESYLDYQLFKNNLLFVDINKKDYIKLMGINNNNNYLINKKKDSIYNSIFNIKYNKVLKNIKNMIFNNNNNNNNNKNNLNKILLNNNFLNTNFNFMSSINLVKFQKIKEEKITKKNEYQNYFKTLGLSRSLGDISCEEIGIISEPEIVECDLKINRGKFIVLGTASLWKFLKREEVGNIVRKFSKENDSFGACKELENIARERWKQITRKIEDITVVVVFLEWKN